MPWRGAFRGEVDAAHRRRGSGAVPLSWFQTLEKGVARGIPRMTPSAYRGGVPRLRHLTYRKGPGRSMPARALRSPGLRGGGAAPAGVVGLPRHLGVGNRADGGADLELLVRLDGGLLAAAVGLAPHHPDLGAVRDVAAEGGQGQPLPL